jgi:hypothetical protein
VDQEKQSRWQLIRLQLLPIKWKLQRVLTWRPTTKQQLLWAGGIAALAFLIIVICGYLFGWKWTGLVAVATYTRRTLWDWLDLLIVPVLLAIGGYLFTRSQNRRTREDAKLQRELDSQLAEERRQDDALQAYLDHMSDMLIPKKDQPSLDKAPRATL